MGSDHADRSTPGAAVNAQEAREKDILEELDERAPTAFYWKLTLLSTLGGFLFGYDTSNIGAALNFVPYHLTGFWAGLPGRGRLGGRRGRGPDGRDPDRPLRAQAPARRDAAIYAVGAILSAVTPDAEVLLAARTLIGWRSARTPRSPPPTSPSTPRRAVAARWRCCSSG